MEKVVPGISSDLSADVPILTIVDTIIRDWRGEGKEFRLAIQRRRMLLHQIHSPGPMQDLAARVDTRSLLEQATHDACCRSIPHLALQGSGAVRAPRSLTPTLLQPRCGHSNCEDA